MDIQTDHDPEEPTVPKSIFVLGPSLDAVYEPFPVPVEPALPGVPHRRELSFQDAATSPGGIVNHQLLPPAYDDDVIPINAYAFFVPKATRALAGEGPLTPDFFFKSGAPVGSVHLGAADQSGSFSIAVPGVKPSLDPYLVQIVLEFLI